MNDGMFAAVYTGFSHSLSTICGDWSVEVRCRISGSLELAHTHAPATPLLLFDHNHAPYAAVYRLLVFAFGKNRAFLAKDCAMEPGIFMPEHGKDLLV